MIRALFTARGDEVPDNLIVEEEPELRNQQDHGGLEDDQGVQIDQRESAARGQDISSIKHHTGSQSRPRIDAEVLSQESSERKVRPVIEDTSQSESSSHPGSAGKILDSRDDPFGQEAGS